MYTDGHATKTPIKELNRAAWAAAEINEEGEIMAYVRGAMPWLRDPPQLSCFPVGMVFRTRDVSTNCRFLP